MPFHFPRSRQRRRNRNSEYEFFRQIKPGCHQPALGPQAQRSSFAVWPVQLCPIQYYKPRHQRNFSERPSETKFTTQTATIGAVWSISPQMGSDFHFNYSRNHASSNSTMDNFLGAVPLTSLPFPSPYTAQNASFEFQVFQLGQQGLTLQAGDGQELIQRQFNIVDNVYLLRGSHSLKFGFDYRRLSPIFSPFKYDQGGLFLYRCRCPIRECCFWFHTSEARCHFPLPEFGFVRPGHLASPSEIYANVWSTLGYRSSTFFPGRPQHSRPHRIRPQESVQSRLGTPRYAALQHDVWQHCSTRRNCLRLA